MPWYCYAATVCAVIPDWPIPATGLCPDMLYRPKTHLTPLACELLYPPSSYQPHSCSIYFHTLDSNKKLEKTAKNPDERLTRKPPAPTLDFSSGLGYPLKERQPPLFPDQEARFSLSAGVAGNTSRTPYRNRPNAGGNSIFFTVWPPFQT